MNRFHMYALLTGACFYVSHAGSAAAAVLPVPEMDDDARVLLQASDFHSLELSPDAKWAAYFRRETVIEKNGYRYSLVLRPTNGAGAEKIVERTEVISNYAGGGFVRWSPDGKTFVFRSPGGSVKLYTIGTASILPIQTPKGADQTTFTSVVYNGGLEWSPDGSKLAFLAAASTAQEAAEPINLYAGVELTEQWTPERSLDPRDYLRSPRAQPSTVWILELKTGQLRKLEDEGLDVLTYAWSPDGKHFAVVATEDNEVSLGVGCDLYLVDIESGQFRPWVEGRVIYMTPVWSPDGGSIAFASQAPYTTAEEPRNRRYNSTLMSVSARDPGKIQDLLSDYRGQEWLPMAVRELQWRDPRWIEFEGNAQLRAGRYRVGRDGKGFEALTPRKVLENCSLCDSRGKYTICMNQSPLVAPRVVLSADRGRSWKTFDPGIGADHFSGSSAEVIQWRSQDNLWDIHGILLKPKNYDPKVRYPLIVFVQGGPAMVSAEFGITRQYPLPAWVQRGFLVLAPNTRGRGGYGPAFDAAIANEHSSRVVPAGDVLSGVDALVARGLADETRLGISGFSYGFGLALETIAQSQRFKAAALGDGVVDNIISRYTQLGRAHAHETARDQAGAFKMFEPEEYERMLRESTLFRLQKITTPVLAEFGGAHNFAATHGRMLLQTLRYRQVPVELIAYPRTGHGVNEPLLRADNIRRNLEWFDYWLLNKPTERMTQRYGAR